MLYVVNRPVLIEVPHFASLHGKEREITILRSENGHSWHEHTIVATEDAIHKTLGSSFEGEGMYPPHPISALFGRYLKLGEHSVFSITNTLCKLKK